MYTENGRDDPALAGSERSTPAHPDISVIFLLVPPSYSLLGLIIILGVRQYWVVPASCASQPKVGLSQKKILIFLAVFYSHIRIVYALLHPRL